MLTLGQTFVAFVEKEGEGMERTFFEWVWLILNEYSSLFLRGTGYTLMIAVAGTVIGFVLGLLIGIARCIPVSPRHSWQKRVAMKLLHMLLGIYIEVFRGTPMIVQSMVIYYGLQMQWGIRMNPLVAGIVIVSINTGAYMAELVRGGIISVDPGQTEGAQSIGMNHAQTMLYVILPQAIRNIMPSIGNEFIINIKDSSVLNVIAVSELFFVAKSAAGTYLRYFESFFIIAVIYLCLTFTISRLLRLVERRMDGDDSFVIHGSQTDSRAAIRTRKRGGIA